MPPGQSHRLFALAGFVALVAACLPAGDPPVGQQVRAGRDRNLVGVLPARSPDDGVLRVLLAAPRVGETETDADLHLLSVPRAGAATEQLLGEHWVCPVPDCVKTDSKGRVFVTSVRPADDFPSWLVRVDPQTGDRREFGPFGSIELSPSRERAAVLRHKPTRAVDVIEADDATTTIGDSSGMFVGEDYYYLDQTKTLRRLAAHAAPEPIREGVDFYSPIYPPEGLRLVLVYAGDVETMRQRISLVDPATLDEQPLPFSVNDLVSLSPDARWALLYDGDKVSNRRFALIDLATGAKEPFELPGDLDHAEWRPGRSEVWLLSYDVQQQIGGVVTSIKRPGQPLAQTPAHSAGLTNLATGGPTSIFTSDGDHWFFWIRPLDRQDETYFVGDADDPGGNSVPLNPGGSIISGGYRELSGGRLLIDAFYESPERSDIYAVDANSGETLLLGRQGVVLAAGARRVLAKLRQANLAGDLTAIDVDSGTATLLAAEFSQTAFLQPPSSGAGAAEPGTTVAFQFLARFDSPYDGIWVTALP